MVKFFGIRVVSRIYRLRGRGRKELLLEFEKIEVISYGLEEVVYSYCLNCRLGRVGRVRSFIYFFFRLIGN